jgi:hypothetical protein
MKRNHLWLIASLLAASTAHATPTTLGGQQYVDQCRAAGVPIPPDWTSPLWIKKGGLDAPLAPNQSPDKTFISENAFAEVFYATSSNPVGVCVALPRFTTQGGNNAVLLGIICQGKVTGNACFWDNSRDTTNDGVKNGRGFTIGRNQFVPIVSTTGGLSFSGGADLEGATGGACTTCHAGENAFIVHPGTALDLGDGLMKPDRWYTPIVPGPWPDNPGPSNQLDAVMLGAGDRSCLNCHGPGGHRFPQFSTELKDENGGSAYCGTGGEIDEALRLTMPAFQSPSSFVPAATDPAFAKHVAAIRAACNMAPSTPPSGPMQRRLTPAELAIVLD